MTRPADYLARVARSGIGQAYKPIVLDHLDLKSGQTVLDLGCGPGSDLPAILSAVGPTGRVIGADMDSDALETARREHPEPWLRIVETDAHSLDLQDGSIDRVHTDRVLQHVASPSLVLSEVRRVLKPGGRAAFAEPDWGTLAIDFENPEVAERYRRFTLERVVRNSRIGRELTRLTEAAGLSAVGVVPITSVFTNVAKADQVLGFARVTGRAVEAGYLTPADGQRWLDSLSSGPFFASVSLFIVVAERLG